MKSINSKTKEKKTKTLTSSEYFKQAEKLYADLFYKDELPIVSKISHDLIEKGSLKGHEHNCIGCNLSNSLTHIHFFLQTVPIKYDKEYNYKLFFYLSYLLVEQVEFIYNIFSYKGFLRDDDVFVSKYPTFIQIKRWTNFFKHPKYFILVHHPCFTYEKDKSYKELTEQVDEIIFVDDNFIKKYYKSEGNREILFKEIANKSNIVVVFPDLLELIRNFHRDMERFIENITNDENYMRIINEQATLENYYEMDED